MLPQAAPEPVKLKVVAPETREVLALRHFKYTNAQGAVVCVGKFQRHSMPAALATKAIKLGCAAEFGDPRVKGQIGMWSMMVPDPERCDSIDGTPDASPKTSRSPVITSSHFEPMDLGPGYTMRVPVEAAAATRSMPSEETRTVLEAMGCLSCGGPFEERGLVIDPRGIDLSLVKAGRVPILDSHGSRRLGRVVDAWIGESCGVLPLDPLIGKLQFDDSKAGWRAHGMIERRELTGCSIGIRHTRMAFAEPDGTPLDVEAALERRDDARQVRIRPR
jgi:hypothetical protein